MRDLERRGRTRVTYGRPPPMQDLARAPRCAPRSARDAPPPLPCPSCPKSRPRCACCAPPASGASSATCARCTPAPCARCRPTMPRGSIGRRIVAVERVGKHQTLALDDGSAVHAHFRMTGDWHVGRVGDPLPALRARRARSRRRDPVALVDPRALGGLRWHAGRRASRAAHRPGRVGQEFEAPRCVRRCAAAASRSSRHCSTSASSPASATSTRRRRAGWRRSILASSRAALGTVRCTRLVAAIRQVLARRARRSRTLSGRRVARAAARLRARGRAVHAVRRSGPTPRAGGPLDVLLRRCQRR